jgi:hypothetical protein
VPPAPAAGTEPTSEASDNAGDPAPAAPPDGWAANPGWTAPPPAQLPDERRSGRAGLFLGVLLVVFGAIAMANALIPGWAVSGLLWPGFVLALGAALLVASIRRTPETP